MEAPCVKTREEESGKGGPQKDTSWTSLSAQAGQCAAQKLLGHLVDAPAPGDPQLRVLLVASILPPRLHSSLPSRLCSGALRLFARPPDPLAAALATVSALSVSPPFSLCPNKRSPLGIHYDELLTARDFKLSTVLCLRRTRACQRRIVLYMPRRRMPTPSGPPSIMFRARANTFPAGQTMALRVG
ncbi:hypothetical protein FIE12Z_11737 [Fusarium flagelliforme]|uniref:Uncharacterized protein n=1 Tax=Fusarium flagelliforme TaxID=2675880 RepID=A0A395M806_9HYPO|nr:hypothetical protein FIE12Z_11737 [Fusarium flagelliforme]